ncbi:hypothetical protein [Aliarcobacter cibarius]|uniref:hypothetical protein n=1 Tax=Aliarcobacter cibarius TaxID=255507 RepID=UPI001248A30D|nr:hypothetical protein [Aliarcobacter cibarius]
MNIFVKVILIIIGSLTLYSVTNDIVTFIELKMPNSKRVIEEKIVKSDNGEKEITKNVFME